MKKKVLSLALALTMALSVSAMAVENSHGPIMGENSTYIPTVVEAQRYITEKGWMTGTDKGFEPELAVNRATMYEIFWKMEGAPQVNNKMATFPDAQGKWFESSARWAEQEGLTTGTDKGYEGDREITKAEAATILYRYMKDYKKLDVTVEEWSLEVFEDADKVQSWAVEPMTWAWLSGVACQLDSDPTLDPEDQVTRMELAKMLTVMGGIMDNQSSVSGKPASISKYGNVLLDVTGDAFAAAGFEVGDLVQVTIGDKKVAVQAPFGTGYSNVDQGSEIITVNDGYVQLAINRGDFATTYGLGEKGEDGAYTLADAQVRLDLLEKGGYLQEMELRAIDDKRTNVRTDYASDEVFANFRAVNLGGLAKDRLYRSSNPVNPELGRNTYSDALIKKAGVKAALNLADDEKTMKGYEGYAGSYYSTIQVMALNMGVDVKADDFNAKLKDGLVWLTAQKGPYMIHCTEGKDRAGFVAALLECLCGASVEDVVNDYMLSFENYYFVEKGSEQWDYIARSNIEKSILDITGAADIAAAKELDLAKAAESYLVKTVGMTATQVSALKDALTK